MYVVVNNCKTFFPIKNHLAISFLSFQFPKYVLLMYINLRNVLSKYGRFILKHYVYWPEGGGGGSEK
jgi:hypothetical protein